MTGLVERLVPDELWVLFRRVVPEKVVVRPQGGGRRRAGDREVLAAIVFVATTGRTWRQVPPVVGPAWPTVYRRFAQWSQAPGPGPAAPRDPRRTRCRRRTGLVPPRDRLRQRPCSQRGQLTGPGPTDRRKSGSKFHLIVDRTGLPISVAITAANTHDSLALRPLVQGIPPVRGRRGPRRRKPAELHADKGYDYDHLRRRQRRRSIVPRIARRGIESSQRLGRHRWVLQGTMSWLSGCRRLHRRCERKPEHFLAFTAIATSLINCRRLTK